MRHEVQRIDNTVRALLDRARPRLVSVRLSSLTNIVQRAVKLARAQLTNSAAGATGTSASNSIRQRIL